MLQNLIIYVPTERRVFISDELHTDVKEDLLSPENKDNEETQYAIEKVSEKKSEEALTSLSAPRVESRGTMSNKFKAYTIEEDRHSNAILTNFS